MRRLFGWCCLAVLSSAGAGRNSTGPIHIVHILADDLGYNDVGWHNSAIQTPTLTRLAEQGVRLNRFYAWKYCAPSRASILTGRYPHNVGYYGNGPDVPLDFTLTPQLLKRAGYRTHLLGKWHLGFSERAWTPTYRGFDSWLGYHNGMEDYWNHTFAANQCKAACKCDSLVDMNNNSGSSLRPVAHRGEYSSYMYTAEAERIIAAHPGPDIPLYLYLTLQSVHGPFEAPADVLARFPATMDKGRRVLSAMVLAMDWVAGNITQALDRAGLWSRTVLLFNSDNGGPVDGGDPFTGLGQPSPQNNLPLRGGKATLWEGGLRVPAFIYSPDTELLPEAVRGTSFNGLAHVSDVQPTFAELAGVSIPADSGPRPLDGMSLWGAIRNGLPSPRKEIVHMIVNQYNPKPTSVNCSSAVAATQYNCNRQPQCDWSPETESCVATRRDRRFSCAASSFCGGALMVGAHKLIVGYPGWDVHAPLSTSNVSAHSGVLHWDMCAEHCLFDLNNDPEERHDISLSEPALLRSMLARFWAASNASGLPPDTHGFDRKQCAVAGKTGFWLPADYET